MHWAQSDLRAVAGTSARSDMAAVTTLNAPVTVAMYSPGPREDMDLLTVRVTSAHGVVWIIVGSVVALDQVRQPRRQ